MAWLAVGGISLAVAAVLLATASRYEYHQDELYFRILAGHLAWGYPDQGPATPLLARAAMALFGDHLWALRVPPALFLAAIVVVVALIARELGGAAPAQVIAGLSVLSFPLISGHVLLTASLDLLLWVAVALCVLRALVRRAPRYWLLGGLLAGIALANKYLIVLLLIAVVAGLLIAGPRAVLRTPWPWRGVAVTLLVGLPNLLYQASHGWPQLSMAQELAARNAEDARAMFLPMLGPWLVVAIGLVLIRRPLTAFTVRPRPAAGPPPPAAAMPARTVAVGFLAVSVLVYAIGAQPYYLLGLLLVLNAAASVVVGCWMARRPVRTVLAGVAMALSVVCSGLVYLPLVPVEAVGGTAITAMNHSLGSQLGWRTYVRQVAEVYRSLPAADRARTAIVAANYGETGAVDRYGPAEGLPRASSGHNALYDLGAPAPDTAVVIAVGFPDGAAELAVFESCREAGRLDHGLDIESDEQGRSIRICRNPRAPWTDLWPAFRRLG